VRKPPLARTSRSDGEDFSFFSFLYSVHRVLVGLDLAAGEWTVGIGDDHHNITYDVDDERRTYAELSPLDILYCTRTWTKRTPHDFFHPSKRIIDVLRLLANPVPYST